MLKTLVVVTATIVSVPQMALAETSRHAGWGPHMMHPSANQAAAHNRRANPPMPPGPYRGMMHRRAPMQAFRMPPMPGPRFMPRQYRPAMQGRPMPRYMQPRNTHWQQAQVRAWQHGPHQRVDARFRQYPGHPGIVQYRYNRPNAMPRQPAFAWRPAARSMPQRMAVNPYAQQRFARPYTHQARAPMHARYPRMHPAQQHRAWRNVPARPYAARPAWTNPWQMQRQQRPWSHQRVAHVPRVAYPQWSRPVNRAVRQVAANQWRSPARQMAPAYPRIRRASYQY